MSRNAVTVLGINGHAGHYIAAAFAAAGWEVTGFGRSNRYPLPGVRFQQGDAERAEDIAAAVAGAAVVVNALNLPYHQWDKGRKEAQTARVLEALRGSGKTLLFPGNIYNYAAGERVLTPETPQHPETPRGEIRKRVEAQYEAAARAGDLQVIILRAGDFFSAQPGDWFDLAMLREAEKGKFAVLGERGVAHAWAYLPDLARAFEKLAWHRHELGAVERFHFAGHFVTPEQLAEAVVAAAPVPLKVSRFPRLLFSLLGLFDPTMREVAKMGYLWEHPMELRDDRLAAILGSDFGTPFEAAVAATIAPHFPPARAQAA
ncbi:MAG TPA: NAD-dependent epimerase/dehydratase family protein [Devosiaceae bacterium]|nr:NAD-dependent epimerase/dehydratase family protein [Devosiaceae bacterium]